MSFQSTEQFRKLKTGLQSSLGTALKHQQKFDAGNRLSKNGMKKRQRKQKRRYRPPPVDTSNLTARQLEYRKYLKSTHWKLFRLSVLAKRGAVCEQCGTRHGNPDLHHLTYARLGHELETDVLVLCRTCHESKHRKMTSSPRFQPKGSLVGAGSGSRPAARNETRSGSPTVPSARPSRSKTAGSGVAVSGVSLNQQASEYPGQTGA